MNTGIFVPGGADGIFGPATESALQDLPAGARASRRPAASTVPPPLRSVSGRALPRRGADPSLSDCTSAAAERRCRPCSGPSCAPGSACSGAPTVSSGWQRRARSMLYQRCPTASPRAASSTRPRFGRWISGTDRRAVGRRAVESPGGSHRPRIRPLRRARGESRRPATGAGAGRNAAVWWGRRVSTAVVPPPPSCSSSGPVGCPRPAGSTRRRPAGSGFSLLPTRRRVRR